MPLAQQLNDMNEERRNLEQEMLTIAFEQAAQQEDQKGLVLASGQFHEGINGIVAARLAEKTFKPTILLSTTNPERYTGSGRSAIPDFHLKEALQECADQLVRFGGMRVLQGAQLLLKILRLSAPLLQEFVKIGCLSN